MQAFHEPGGGAGTNISTYERFFQFIPQFIRDVVLLEGITYAPEELACAAQTVLEGVEALLGHVLSSSCT
jgi:hypothetical protein